MPAYTGFSACHTPHTPHSVAILAQVSSIIPSGDFRGPWAVVLWCFAEALLVQSMCARSLDLGKHGRALLGPPSGCEIVLPQFDGAGGGQPWKTVFFGSFVVLLCVLLPPSAQCVLYVFVVSYLVRIEWVVVSVLNVAMLAALVCAATLVSSLGCFQSCESFDGGLGPHFLKLSGLALFAAMVLLRLSVLHWNLDGVFFRLQLVSEKILVIGTVKGRNEGKGVLVQPSAILCRLRPLQVCSLSVAAVAAAFALLEVKLVAAAMAAVVAAAFCYLFVVTTACGFTSGAFISLVECFVPPAAAWSSGCKKISSAATAAACAAAFGYLFVVTIVCGFTSGALLSLVVSFVMSAAALSSGCTKNTSAAPAAAFAAAFGYRFVETTACGFTLGAHFILVDCLILTLFGILVFIACVFAGLCWTFVSVPWSHLANGLVLGLRVLCACTTALVVHARDMLGFQSFEYVLDGFIALEFDGMDRQVLAGSLFLGTGEQASGRVDVPGKDNQQHAAAASMGSGLCLEATRGVQICQPCQDSSAPPVIPVCSILVRTLSGRTRVCSLPTGFTVLDLENCVSDYTAVPCSSFYLTYQGKVLTADQVKNFDSGSLVPVVMHGRLRGGSAIPGAWVCNVCHASGCWPTKNRCFRCGHARNTLVAGAPALSPPVGREAAHPGRAPRAKAAPVNPTFRPPRVIPPKKSSSPANASSPPASPPAQVSPELLVATLRALGIGEDLLKQIQSSIVPPAAPKVERKEQKLFQLRGLIETKKSQVSKLEKSVNHHRSQLEVCLTNKQRREEELAALQAEYRSVTDGKLSPNSTPAASVASSKEPAESCDPDLMEDEPPPPEEGHPVVFELPTPPDEDAEQRTNAKRLKTNDTHASAHGVGHDPALFGQHIALFSDGELDMYMKEIEKRRNAIVDAAASGVLIGDFEEEPDV